MKGDEVGIIVIGNDPQFSLENKKDKE